MKILVFTEGTLLMHKHGKGHTREEIVQQVREKEASVHDYTSYVPIGNAVEKLTTWKSIGAELFYLTSRKKQEYIEVISNVLKKYHFPVGMLVFRKQSEDYKDVVERVKPDVLVEDDCESIGGRNEMAITHIKPALKKRIISVVVKEFEGIDCLILLPIDSLYCSQDTFSEKYNPKKNNTPPLVGFLEDNQYYIIDGHHRIRDYCLNGEKNAFVKIQTSAIAKLAQQERPKLKPFSEVWKNLDKHPLPILEDDV